MREIYKVKKGYSKYLISNKGNVKSKYSGNLLKQQTWGNNYLTVALIPDDTTNISRKVFKVHRLVAELFCENKYSDLTVNHIDGDKLNNNSNNLEWCTIAQNILHAVKTGLSNPIGESNNNSKLTELDVLEIRKRYSQGEKLSSIRKDFDIGVTQSYRIVRRELWKNI